MKKATTVEMVLDLASFANLVKLGVAVPPDTKEPITRPAPPITLKVPLEAANWSMMVPSPLCTANTMAAVPKIATKGTAI